MALKAQLEALVYAADEPITFEHIFALLKEDARRELHKEIAVAVAEEEQSVTKSGEAPQPEGSTTGAPVSDAHVKSTIRATLEELITDYNSAHHGIEIRQVAGGYRMATKPEHHDTVRAFAKSLKPPIRLSLPALETLAVVAYKQPITAPEIGEIRGVDVGGVLGTLLDRKLITTAGRKQVIGRPILYKTTKEFLLRFGLGDVSELPSMEEFEKLAAESFANDTAVAELPFEASGEQVGTSGAEEPGGDQQDVSHEQNAAPEEQPSGDSAIRAKDYAGEANISESDESGAEA